MALFLDMTTAPDLGKLGLYLTQSFPCNYLPGREASTLFVDPISLNTHVYTLLSQHGFRRSGEHLYRPNCTACQACVAVRIPVAEFEPNRCQRRTWRKNQDLMIQAVEDHYDPEHFALYQGYQTDRHQGGGMDNPSVQDYIGFLTSSWSKSTFHEIRLQGKLLGVAVVDELDDALSAVYTFFDPHHAQRSLGRYMILHEIRIARQRDLKWLYLGYWIAGCRKMRYKNEYQPLQYYYKGRWQNQEPNPLGCELPRIGSPA